MYDAQAPDSNADLRDRLAALSPSDRVRLLTRLRQHPQSDALPAAPRRFPLSHSQLGIWIAEQLTPGTTAFHNPAALRLLGALDPTALRAALRDVQRRHAPLRGRYLIDDDGIPVAEVLPPDAAPLPWSAEDVSGTPQPERTADDLTRALARTPFDLALDPPWRILLVRLAKDDHLLVIVLHHLVSDGWSLGILFAELQDRYARRLRGDNTPAPAPSPDYFTLAAKTRTDRESASYQADLDSVVRGLTDAPRAVPLPSPAPHGNHFAHREGAAREVSLPGHEAALLQAACDRQGVTLFSGLLTGFLVLLCGYGDQRDLVVATPTAGRREAGSHRLIGCFVNTVLLRLDLRDNPSLAQLTLRCQNAVREALGRERVALTDVVSRLPRTTTSATGGPTNVMLVQNNAPFGTSEFAGLRAERHRLPPSAVQRDWTVNVAQTDGGLQGEFEHAAHFSDRDIAVAQRRLTAAWRLVATALDTPFEEAVRETAERA